MSKVKISIQGQDEKAVLDCLDSAGLLKRGIQQQLKNSEFLWIQENGSHLAIPTRSITAIEISE